jgi:hypothetical protein
MIVDSHDNVILNNWLGLWCLMPLSTLSNSNIIDVDLHLSFKNLIINLNKESLFIYDPSQEFNYRVYTYVIKDKIK